MTSRRNFLLTGGTVSALSFLSKCSPQTEEKKSLAKFSYCLNTSTISGQNPGIKRYIEIASQAGYDGIELWVKDVKSYIESGNSAIELRDFIRKKGLKAENAIGFAPWLVPGEEGKEKGFKQMKEEMEIMASIGCTRIAASPAGLSADHHFDFFEAGKRYRELIETGKEIGIMPQLEFWGASPVLNHFGQIIMIAAFADHPDVHILPDVYHLFRGGSGFEALKMMSRNVIEIFHMNDYVDSIPREIQTDKDRVYPGDGVAPMTQILSDLSAAGGNKVLSVELFNETYWKKDPLSVAKTALQKMKLLTEKVCQ